MDSIKEKVAKVVFIRKRLLEIKEEVLRLEDIIKKTKLNHGNDKENSYEEEYEGLKKAHKEAKELINQLQIEKEHWREITKIMIRIFRN